MKWGVEIQKTSLDRRNVSDLLAGLEFNVSEINGVLTFTSQEMGACRDASEAFDIAKRLRTAMTGPAQIDKDFQLGAVVEFSPNPPKRYVFLEPEPIKVRVSIGAPRLSLLPPQGLSDAEHEAWKKQDEEREYQAALERQRSRLEPAFRNDNATKVLSLLSESKPAGATLYKIYEIVRGYFSNGREFRAQLGISKIDIKRFADAVHNPAVSGDWARHAYPDEPKTDSPMSKSEAELFVRRIAELWLDKIRKSGEVKNQKQLS